MFRHTDYLQFDAQPEKPDPVYAHKLQELIGGAYGEMTVTMQYLFQGWNCRMPGKYKDDHGRRDRGDGPRRDDRDHDRAAVVAPAAVRPARSALTCQSRAAAVWS